jgi:hypothetical protein
VGLSRTGPPCKTKATGEAGRLASSIPFAVRQAAFQAGSSTGTLRLPRPSPTDRYPSRLIEIALTERTGAMGKGGREEVGGFPLIHGLDTGPGLCYN